MLLWNPIPPKVQWEVSLLLLTLRRGNARDPCFQLITVRPLSPPEPVDIQPPLFWIQRIMGRWTRRLLRLPFLPLLLSWGRNPLGYLHLYREDSRPPGRGWPPGADHGG
ncbi:hypothetical protein LIER_14147 [Lithospermum erythrorhizon]|uniref:Uncharacterized protein n=1 Tax=Lithospermum erythrorhizon TaxID=34254 RepID=A0AAV3Q2N8_LITER